MSLPKVVDSYSIAEICKMKNLQMRPYVMSGLPLEEGRKSYKEELTIVPIEETLKALKFDETWVNIL